MAPPIVRIAGLPSDMYGIVYVPFKNSVADAKKTIITELEAVGYVLKTS